MMSMLEQDRWSLFERGQVLTFDTSNNIEEILGLRLLRQMSRLDPKTKGGKSGLHRAGCSVTRSPGDGKESATENIPPH